MSIREERKILLLPPYSEIYEFGYTYYHSVGQYDIPKLRLKHKNGEYETINYSRYIIGVKLGKILDKSERVIHKDGNPQNNNIDNLEIKSIKVKPPLKPKAVYEEMDCEFCNTRFIKNPLQQHNFCSQVCKSKALKKKKIEYENKLGLKKIIQKTKAQRNYNEYNLKHRDPILIEPPYKSLYESGYLTQDRKGKPILHLKKINETTYSHSMFYDRYLAGIKLNKILDRSDRIIYIDGILTIKPRSN